MNIRVDISVLDFGSSKPEVIISCLSELKFENYLPFLKEAAKQDPWFFSVSEGAWLSKGEVDERDQGEEAYYLSTEEVEFYSFACEDTARISTDKFYEVVVYHIRETIQLLTEGKVEVMFLNKRQYIQELNEYLESFIKKITSCLVCSPSVRQSE